jgi:hypothetical protein
MKVLCLFILIGLSGAWADASELEQHVLKKVLLPWIAEHCPKYQYVGIDNTGSGNQYTWRFLNRDDPRQGTTFPIAVGMDFCQSPKTAHLFLHCNDWNVAAAVKNNALPVGYAVKSPVQAGDESDAFDTRTTEAYKSHPDWMGGWVKVRVANCLFSIQSYSLRFEDIVDLARRIARDVPNLPEPPPRIRRRGESGFLKTITQSRRAEREVSDYEHRMAAKPFSTASELYAKFREEHPEYEVDKTGLTADARSTWNSPPTGVSEVGLDRGTYGVNISDEGRVSYFGASNVPHLGARYGRIPKWKFQRIAEFVKDAGVAAMHETYEDISITDQETVYTTFVIDGQRKSISNYAISAPSSLWAIEQLIDQLLSETAWDDSTKRHR